MVTLLITCLTHHFAFILSFILGGYYFPYSSSCISIYSCLYSAPNLLFNIFSITHLLTLLNLPLYIPNYLLTSFPQLTFIYSPLLALPLLILSLSYSPYPIQHYFPYLCPLYPFLYHIKTLLTLIFTTQLNPLLLLKILPLNLFISFLFFSIPYFQLKHKPLLLYFIFYITLLTFITIFTIHYSLFSITTLCLIITFIITHLSFTSFSIITHIYSLSISPWVATKFII